MSVYVDTSAFIAVLDRDDANHKKADRAWRELVRSEETLVCSNYILVETFALAQHRMGIAAARVFQEDIIPVLEIDWVDENGHQAGTAGVLSAGRKKLSLVDCVSFNTMRRLGIKGVFTFDRHFRKQGFKSIP